MSAQSQAVPVAIVPFWERLPGVMLYPAHASAMATIVLLALGRLVLLFPFFGIFIFLALVAAMYRYGFECLRSTADGYLQPPDVSSGSNIGWKFIGLILILFVVAAIVMAKLGPLPGLILLLFFGIALPGAIMTLAMEESLVEALNPLKWIAIMTGVGWPYLAVVGLCLAISYNEGYATHAVGRLLPLPVALVVMGIISNYALVMTFHLMGYLLYQYHEELGFVPAAAQLERPADKADPTQASLDEVGALVRDGKLEEAIERTRALLRGHGAGPAVHAQYRKLLRAAGDKAALLEHGRDSIGNLIDHEEDRAAVELLRECQAIDPGFAPATALQVTKLAHMASRQNQPQAALLLVKDFHERFPNSQYVAANYLLAAELLHEHVGKDEEACALLQYLKQTVPNDPLMPEIDAKLQAIERMIAATKKPARPQS
jgi:tetratricopeptide (TPR) repeat protein